LIHAYFDSLIDVNFVLCELRFVNDLRSTFKAT